MKVETFKGAARIAAGDADGITDRDLSNLRSAFQTMTPADKEDALAFLLVQNMPRTYASMRDLAPDAHNFGFDSFKSGVRAAAGDPDGITDRDLANIRDAFSRLTSGDQERALAFLSASPTAARPSASKPSSRACAPPAATRTA